MMKRLSNEKLPKVVKSIKEQRSYVMIKPDGVMRGIIGDAISRFERAGLRIVAMKMITPTRDQVIAHYPMSDEAWVQRLGIKSKSGLEKLDLNITEILGTEDESIIGKQVVEGLIDYMTSGPVICMIIEGVNAIDMIRKITGATLPCMADMGTIRGDYSIDSPIIANSENRSIHNLIHASENPEEAENEIKLWFKENEINDYELGNQEIMYYRYY